MRILILGAGNFLLSDEGFGVHCLRFLEREYVLPAAAASQAREVRLLDAGTLGLPLISELESAERVYLLDALNVEGEPGSLRRFSKDEFTSRLQIKVSPHQAGVQEAIAITTLRGRCPNEIFVLGVIPVSMRPGLELSPEVQARVPEVAAIIADDLRELGIEVKPRAR